MMARFASYGSALFLMAMMLVVVTFYCAFNLPLVPMICAIVPVGTS
jgi:hypothetical protein